MPSETIVNPAQKSAYDSPWPMSQRFLRVLWEFCWTLFCVWTPKPLNQWRLFWLRVFDAKIDGTPFVHQRARIAIPWRPRQCLFVRRNRNRRSRHDCTRSLSQRRHPRFRSTGNAVGRRQDYNRRRCVHRRARVYFARGNNRRAQCDWRVFGRD
jgi:hypothetical protein